MSAGSSKAGAFGRSQIPPDGLALAWHWWHLNVGTFPVNYMNPMGVCGNFLYEETGDPSIPAGLDYAIRRAATLKAPVGASAIASLFESLPYAMDVVARCRRWLRAACNDYGSPVSIAVNKGNNGVVDLAISIPRRNWAGNSACGALGSLIHGGRICAGARTQQRRRSARIPKDARADVTRSSRRSQGNILCWPAARRHGAACHELLVLAGAGAGRAGVFQGDGGQRRGPDFFAGRARPVDPQGQALDSADGVQGWIDLPADKPGLWVSSRWKTGWYPDKIFRHFTPSEGRSISCRRSRGNARRGWRRCRPPARQVRCLFPAPSRNPATRRYHWPAGALLKWRPGRRIPPGMAGNICPIVPAQSSFSCGHTGRPSTWARAMSSAALSAS